MSNQTKFLWIDNGKGKMVDVTSSVKEGCAIHVPRGTRRETFLRFMLDYEATLKLFFFSNEPGEYKIKFIDLEERKVYEGTWGAKSKTSIGQTLQVCLVRGPRSRERSVVDSEIHNLNI